MKHEAFGYAKWAVMACLAVGAVALPAPAAASVARGIRVRPMSGTKTTVACKRLHPNHLRCMMTIKGGARISGTVRMRITRGTLLVATGRGRLSSGKATLTMRVLHRMTPGTYTVAMVVTISATMILRIR
jgi:hypothetical protein